MKAKYWTLADLVKQEPQCKVLLRFNLFSALGSVLLNEPFRPLTNK
jgi:hypothetical protein